MSREPVQTWFFVLAVVRRGDSFLLVHERKHGQLWYLPAGRVEPGEDFLGAAKCGIARTKPSEVIGFQLTLNDDAAAHMALFFYEELFRRVRDGDCHVSRAAFAARRRMTGGNHQQWLASGLMTAWRGVDETTARQETSP